MRVHLNTRLLWYGVHLLSTLILGLGNEVDVVKQPEWLPRAQETHWLCKSSLCLCIAAVWGHCPAWNGAVPGSICREFDSHWRWDGILFLPGGWRGSLFMESLKQHVSKSMHNFPFFSCSFLVLACRYLPDALLDTGMPAEINYLIICHC